MSDESFNKILEAIQNGQGVLAGSMMREWISGSALTETSEFSIPNDIQWILKHYDGLQPAIQQFFEDAIRLLRIEGDTTLANMQNWPGDVIRPTSEEDGDLLDKWLRVVIMEYRNSGDIEALFSEFEHFFANNHEIEEMHDFVDLDEAFDKVQISAKAGKVAAPNNSSPSVKSPVATGKKEASPIKVDADLHKGFNRETAPSVKDSPIKKIGNPAEQLSVKATSSALLNKDQGKINTKSPVVGVTKRG